MYNHPLTLLFHWISAPFQYRSLLRGFLRQEIKGRYAASMGGLLWAVLTPLANILIYIFVFSVVMKIRIPEADTGTSEFHIYLLAALLPWMAFAESINRSTSILLEKSALITKVSFPVQLLPYVGVLGTFILNALAIGLLLVYLLFKGYFGLAWLWLVPVYLFHLLFALGIIAFAAAVCVFIRDLQQLVTLLMQVWFFMTPIIYPLSLVPDPYRAWMLYNPLYYFAELYRDILLLHTVQPWEFAGAGFLSVFVFATGGWFFMRIKHAFGDVL